VFFGRAITPGTRFWEQGNVIFFSQFFRNKFFFPKMIFFAEVLAYF
jgi:hypothetical protein